MSQSTERLEAILSQLVEEVAYIGGQMRRMNDLKEGKVDDPDDDDCDHVDDGSGPCQLCREKEE